jgi:hypothetical protein
MKNKSLIDTKLIADFFGMSRLVVNKHLAKKSPLDLIYIVFNDDNLTTREKRTYLYHNTDLTLNMKNNLWERFNGDYGFEYCKTGSMSLEF